MQLSKLKESSDNTPPPGNSPKCCDKNPPDLKNNKHRIFVTWDPTDKIYVGLCPTLTNPATHGDNEVDVYEQTVGVINYLIESGIGGWPQKKMLDHQPTKWVDWDQDGNKYVGKCFHEGEVKKMCIGDERVAVYRKLCEEYNKKYGNGKYPQVTVTDFRQWLNDDELSDEESDEESGEEHGKVTSNKGFGGNKQANKSATHQSITA